MAKDRERVEVEILDVRETKTFPKPGEAFITHIVTYRYADQPARSVFIPADEDTPENRAKIIRADLEKARAQKPERMTV